MRVFHVSFKGHRVRDDRDTVWAMMMIFTDDHGLWRDELYRQCDLSGVLIPDKDIDAIELSEPRVWQLDGNVVVVAREVEEKSYKNLAEKKEG